MHTHDRRHLSIRELAMIGTLLLNFGALVWGAATLTSTVSELKTATQQLNTTVQRMSDDLTSLKVEYNARLGILEDRSHR